MDDRLSAVIELQATKAERERLGAYLQQQGSLDTLTEQVRDDETRRLLKVFVKSCNSLLYATGSSEKEMGEAAAAHDKARSQIGKVLRGLLS
jgi:hypothetical protein